MNLIASEPTAASSTRTSSRPALGSLPPPPKEGPQDPRARRAPTGQSLGRTSRPEVPMAAHLLRLARACPPADAGLTDAELLARYAGGRDEAAFAELVRRNGAVVLRACRSVLG